MRAAFSRDPVQLALPLLYPWQAADKGTGRR
jgi:hypothetical protein